jgi:ABC-type antimicrobial peptide transport system permease subunit
MTIVGVVGNVRPVLQMSIGPQMYVSYLQQSEPNVTLMIRSQPGAAVPIEAVKQALWSVVPEQPVFDIRPLEAMTAQWLAQPRLIAQLLGGFAALAFLMSTLGVYMIVTYLTTQRTKEVAVRRAIGATSRDIVRLLTGQTARWTIAGVVVGIGGAIAATSTLDAVLTGIARPEATTVAAIGALYLIVVIAAVCIPAARALRLDPSVVLRTE